MSKIGTAHVEIKPVLNEPALAAVVKAIEDAVGAALARGLGSPPDTTNHKEYLAWALREREWFRTLYFSEKDRADRVEAQLAAPSPGERRAAHPLPEARRPDRLRQGAREGVSRCPGVIRALLPVAAH